MYGENFICILIDWIVFTSISCDLDLYETLGMVIAYSLLLVSNIPRKMIMTWRIWSHLNRHTTLCKIIILYMFQLKNQWQPFIEKIKVASPWPSYWSNPHDVARCEKSAVKLVQLAAGRLRAGWAPSNLQL